MYDYKKQRKNLFTDKGQRMFLKVRDWVNKVLKQSGAFQMNSVIGNKKFGVTTAWDAMACIDRLVELGEIDEILVNNPDNIAQLRVFTRPFS